jgi:transglutaminase-like putative cysteine protease
VSGSRWLDHLPPWLAWGALASTGAYEPGELGTMALPLLGAALVQWRGWSLEPWRRVLELACLGAGLALLALRAGVLLTVVYLLFLLCGVRLALPRGLPQRRQILLMGFLLFLTTTVTTADLDFLAWSAAWVAGAGAVLLQLTWESSAALRQGPFQPPPRVLAVRWTAWTLVLAAGFFVILPRLHLGARRLPLGAHDLGGLRAGLSDVLDLSDGGLVLGSREVALRIQPVRTLTAQEWDQYRQALALLRGYVLERLDGQRWETGPDTPGPRPEPAGALGAQPVTADFFFSPGLLGTLPLPYGDLVVEPPGMDPLRLGPGGSLRWTFPVRRTTALRVGLTPDPVQPAPPPRGRRLAELTATGAGCESARAWSQRIVPVSLPPRELAENLALTLRSEFKYTLDNPSGAAANPLQDFLERSHAGHCEYFASALAVMLRYRGIPARVVNGFRLGPWIEEGGYFLVTQNEAHSWVEYYDPEAGGWRAADPTPPAPPSRFGAETFLATLARWTDAVRFRWDRNVVRFSDEDQVAGLDRLTLGFDALARRWSRSLAMGLGILGLGGALAWLLIRPGRPPWPWPHPGGPGRIRELDPLVRRARRLLPPREAETARSWLERLAQARPQRAAPLARLAREADTAAYGDRPSGRLKHLAREEAKAWKE